MRRFVFRLQAVLDVRQRQEEQTKHGLARAQTALNEARSRRESAESRLAAESYALAELGSGAVSPELLQVRRSYLSMLAGRLADERASETQCVEELGRARLALSEAARARRVVERLRERAQTEYARQEGRREQGTLDEVAATRAARASGRPASDHVSGKVTGAGVD